MTARRSERFWSGLVVLILAMLLTLYLSRAILDEQEILASGTLTNGFITAHETISGRGTRYKITYQYQPQGNAPAVIDTADISKNDWDRLQIGDSVTLRYRTDRPQMNVLLQPTGHDSPLGWMFALIMWAWALTDLSKSRTDLTQHNPNTVSQASIDYFERNQRRR